MINQLAHVSERMPVITSAIHQKDYTFDFVLGKN